MYLRQSTASQEIMLGRFVDSLDGDTEEVGLTIANTDIKIFKGGATTLASKNSGGATHVANGIYSAVLDATDTDTVGMLEVHVHVAGALAVRHQYYVVEEAVYDALFAASAAGYQVPIWAAANSTVNLSDTTIKTATDVETDTADIQARIPAALTAGGNMKSDALALSGDTTAADNAESFFDGAGYGAILQRTTIATLASQTSFTLTDGSADDNAYNDCPIVIEDAATGAQKCVGFVLDYTGATKTVTLLTDPGIFTMATTDKVTILAGDMTMRYVIAALAGKVSEAGTTTETVKGIDGSTTRLVYTVDASGNRTAVAFS